ncbi:unnamed protein product [Spirodela intermedia]|uniref:RHOMBOID-like protein n=1 Tax=Spirodela intermedia TaxID=51605 RepID=A0A7I8JTX9_SPIIN|nr:unnamed protein product [Spirodela intermedia]CAA6673636.1 unnamed protein product [Spirodela intermedia]
MASRDMENGGRGSAAAGGGSKLNGRGGYEPVGGSGRAVGYRGAVTAQRLWTSWMVPAFVVANIVMFLVTMYCVARFLGRFSFQPLRENPLFGPSARTLKKLGGLRWSEVVLDHQGWRLVSCIWLHAGLIHIVVNMLCLIIIGVRLEQQFGFVRIGPIYLLSGFAGSVLSSLFSRYSVSVGASGALFGLLGAMLSELITNWTIYSNKAAALISLLIIIVINLAVGILPQVDNFAHMGASWPAARFSPESRVKSKYKVYQYIIASFLSAYWFTVGLVMLYRKVNPNDHCSWCHYLSCVPTSKWECPSYP